MIALAAGQLGCGAAISNLETLDALSDVEDRWEKEADSGKAPATPADGDPITVEGHGEDYRSGGHLGWMIPACLLSGLLPCIARMPAHQRCSGGRRASWGARLACGWLW